MAMTASGLSAAIYSAIEAEMGSPQSAEQLQKFCDALGNAIIPYIQGNAVVNTNDNGTVTSGAGAGGAVVATGVGTVS